MSEAIWKNESGSTYCSGCGFSWKKNSEAKCICSGERIVTPLPTKIPFDDIDVSTVEGLLSPDGRGMQKMLAISMIRVSNAKKGLPAAAKKLDTIAKGVNSWMKLHIQDRQEAEVQDLRELKEDLQKVNNKVAELESESTEEE